jgi:hypothetical protein
LCLKEKNSFQHSHKESEPVRSAWSFDLAGRTMGGAGSPAHDVAIFIQTHCSNMIFGVEMNFVAVVVGCKTNC